MKKRFSIIAAVLACVMAFTGCSESILTSGGTASDTVSSSIWTAKDEDVVAWVTADGLTDEQKKYYEIQFKEFYSEYSFNMTNLGIDENNSYYADIPMLYRKQIIEMLTNERIILKKAEELGFDKLSDADMAEIEKGYQENLEEWYTKFSAQAMNDLGIKADSSTDSNSSGSSLTAEQQQQVKAKAKELFNEYIKKFDLTEENFLKWETTTFIERKTFEHFFKDISVSDKEVEDKINKLIADAKAAYDKDVYSYESNAEYTTVWLPEGSRKIKHVFIRIDSSDAAEITAARNESGADNAAIDKLRDEKLAEIKDKAEAALKKATAEGADFNAVIKEYSYNYNPDIKDPTMTIVKGTTAMPENLYDAVYAIEEKGGFSGLVPTDAGYYIFQYVDDAVITDEAAKEYKDKTKTEMLNKRQNDEANKKLEEWSNEVKYEFDYDKLNIVLSDDKNDTSSSGETSSK